MDGWMECHSPLSSWTASGCPARGWRGWGDSVSPEGPETVKYWWFALCAAALWIGENVPLLSCLLEAAQMFLCLTKMKENSIFDPFLAPASSMHLNVGFSYHLCWFLLIIRWNKSSHPGEGSLGPWHPGNLCPPTKLSDRNTPPSATHTFHLSYLECMLHTS